VIVRWRRLDAFASAGAAGSIARTISATAVRRRVDADARRRNDARPSAALSFARVTANACAGTLRRLTRAPRTRKPRVSITCARTAAARAPRTNFTTSRRRAGTRTLETGIDHAPDGSRFAPWTPAVVLETPVVVEADVVVEIGGAPPGAEGAPVVVASAVVSVGVLTVGSVTVVTPGSVTVGSGRPPASARCGCAATAKPSEKSATTDAPYATGRGLRRGPRAGCSIVTSYRERMIRRFDFCL
jgi:hypothetical protein